MTKPLNELSIREAATALRAGTFTVGELWDACHAHAVKKNPELNAYLEIFERDDEAIERAQARITSEGANAPTLCGIPLAIKDNILIEGKVASAASKMLGNYTATYNAGVIQKLKEAGALFVGRTNMDEFALGGSTENSAYGVTKNPHDTARVAGGTSGGSAAAVAAHMALGALGTDTGGSVRNPASYCGIVGVKPTYGSVSRRGVIAAASSFDQVGPLAKTVEDAHTILETISGKDDMDSTSVELPKHKTQVTRVGVLRELTDTLPAPMKQVFDEALHKLEAQGMEIVDVSIPSAGPALAAYYIINFAEVSTNLARYDGIRYGRAVEGESLLEDYVQSRTNGFGAESKRRILLGTFVLSSGYIDAYYRKADRVRELLREEYAQAFKDVDVIATPTMPTPAFVIGEKADPLSLYLEDVFTVTANLTGFPAISVPMGNVDGLPVGLHFIAPYGAHESLFEIGKKVHV